MPWLQPGSWVSVDKTLEHEGQAYWTTLQGELVAKDALELETPHDFKGVELPKDQPLASAAFAGPAGSQFFTRDDEGVFTQGAPISAGTPLRILERVQTDDIAWARVAEHNWVKVESLIVASKAARPAAVDPDAPWIDVDLGQQTLVAYEGKRPVFVTLVSTGRPQADGTSSTPTGIWRIYSKQKTSNLKTVQPDGGVYYVQDVPWVMYFSGTYAIQGAFWQSSFGQPQSHGGINLGPSDARWLFSWTRPKTPPTWHGIDQSRLNPGTPVAIRGQTPAAPAKGR